MNEAEVRAAIEALYAENISDGGFEVLASLLRELVAPGRAQVHAAAVLDELAE